MQHVIKLKTIVSIHFEKVSICNRNIYLVNWNKLKSTSVVFTATINCVKNFHIQYY